MFVVVVSHFPHGHFLSYLFSATTLSLVNPFGWNEKSSHETLLDGVECLVYCQSDSRHRKGLQRFRHLDVRFPKLQAATAAKRVRVSKVPGPESVADSNTQPANRRSPELCRMFMGVTQIPKQFRDPVPSNLISFFVSVSCAHTHTRRDRHELHSYLWKGYTVLYVATANKFWSYLDVPTAWKSDGFGVPTAHRGCQILRCDTCFTLPMNLHDFPSENVTLLHQFSRCPTLVAFSMLVVNVVAEVPRIRESHESSGSGLCCTWTPVVNLRLPTCHGLGVPRGAGESVVSVLISG